MYQYPGKELDLFMEARNWRDYWTSFVGPYLKGDVLEVGAGIGTLTRLLAPSAGSWHALEPDGKLLRVFEDNPIDGVRTTVGTLESLNQDDRYDSILYADVLEHIEDDAGELQRAARFLRPHGRIIVMSPAHQRLYSAFDESVGHYRRYSLESLSALRPPGMRIVEAIYLDSVGIIVSAGNRFVTRSPMPRKFQIRLWDRFFVPLSRILDPLLRFGVGKSALVVFQKDSPD